mmetsp:Transcript_38844/g.97865  ORF Transcript_38844/g.97865 Transcript_38844/m.97865 type:complete len:224 (-) Transcript_38844:1171-1842(-)
MRLPLPRERCLDLLLDFFTPRLPLSEADSVSSSARCTFWWRRADSGVVSAAAVRHAASSSAAVEPLLPGLGVRGEVASELLSLRPERETRFGARVRFCSLRSAERLTLSRRRRAFSSCCREGCSAPLLLARDVRLVMSAITEPLFFFLGEIGSSGRALLIEKERECRFILRCCSDCTRPAALARTESPSSAERARGTRRAARALSCSTMELRETSVVCCVSGL